MLGGVVKWNVQDATNKDTAKVGLSFEDGLFFRLNHL